MSTRWYPLYQRGNPQLRVFLPDFWMKLIRPKHPQPTNIVQFHCSMEMTQFDIENYLKKIYNVKPISVRTRIALGKINLPQKTGYVVKQDDMKIAYVTLDKGESFKFPDLFPEIKDELEEENTNEVKETFKNFLQDNKTPSAPGWFRI